MTDDQILDVIDGVVPAYPNVSSAAILAALRDAGYRIVADKAECGCPQGVYVRMQRGCPTHTEEDW